LAHKLAHSWLIVGSNLNVKAIAIDNERNALPLTWVWRKRGRSPQKPLCEFGSASPARTFVNPRLRQALARYAQAGDSAVDNEVEY